MSADRVDGLVTSHMGGRRFLLFLLTAVAAGTVGARTVTVSHVVRSSGLVHLGFGPGTVGVSNQLYAVRASVDRGAVKDGWEDVRPLGLITPSMESLTWKMPVEWITQKSAVRFFLTNVSYDKRLFSLISDGTPYINTGVTPDATTDITVDSYVSGSVAPFGVAGYFMAFCNGSGANQFYYSYLGISNSPGLDINTIGARHVTRLCRSGLYIDGTQVADFSDDTTTEACDYPIYLFRRKGSDKTTNEKNGYCAVYGAEISKGGTLVRKFIPAIKNGEAGMYDAVSGGFFTNAAPSGTFTTTGAAGHQRFEDAHNFEASSPILFGEREFSASACDLATGRVELTFSAGSAKRLFLVYADMDRGPDYRAWTNVVFAANVPADMRSLSYELPEGVRAANCAYRFILSDADDESGYTTRLASLYGNSGGKNAWIDTGIVPDTKTHIRIRAAVASSSAASFGVAGRFVFFDNGGTTGIFPIFFGHGSTAVTYASVPGWDATAPNLYEFGPDGPLLNGRRLADDAWNFGCDSVSAVVPIALFARRDNNAEAVTLSKTGYIRIYSCYIETNGVPARSFVPCVKGGAYGMFDRISGTFFGNAGTGSFISGVEADAPDLPPEAEKTVSPVFHPASRVSILALDDKTGAVTVRVSGPKGPLALYAVCAQEDLGEEPAAWPISVRLASLTNATGAVEWSGVVPDGLLATNRYLKCYAVVRREEPFGQQYDYVASYATYHINVGIPPDSLTETEMEYAIAGDDAAPSAPTGYADAYYAHNVNNNVKDSIRRFGYCFFGCQDERYSPYRSSTNDFHNVKLGPDGLWVDGNQMANPFLDAVQEEKAGSLYLVGMRNAQGGRVYAMATRIRRFRMKKNGVLLRDMVPCIVNGNNGLWDYVSGKFFGNAHPQGSGASYVGAPVFADRLTAENLLGASSTKFYRGGFKVIFR